MRARARTEKEAKPCGIEGAAVNGGGGVREETKCSEEYRDECRTEEVATAHKSLPPGEARYPSRGRCLGEILPAGLE